MAIENLKTSNIQDIKFGADTKAQESRLDRMEKDIKNRKNQFMKMLMTQMEHQDPTNPTDTNAMASQIFAINGLEQQLETNRSLSIISELLTDSAGHSTRNNQILENILEQVTSNTSAGGQVSAIGKFALMEGDEIQLKDNMAELHYSIPEGMQAIKATIYDAEGNAVKAIDADNRPGDKYLIWDGKGDLGEIQKEGAYTFKVLGINSQNEPMVLPTYSAKLIDGLVEEGGEVNYSINGEQIPAKQVTRIRMPYQSSSRSGMQNSNLGDSKIENIIASLAQRSKVPA